MTNDYRLNNNGEQINLKDLFDLVNTGRLSSLNLQSNTDPTVAALIASGVLTRSALTNLYGPVHAPPPSGGDDTATLQALIYLAQHAVGQTGQTGGKGVLYLQPGEYKVTGLITDQTFRHPRIVGAGIEYTTITVTANNGWAFKFVGGAAGNSTGGPQDMLIKAAVGVTGAIGYWCMNACFTTPRRVEFDPSLARGVLFNNDGAGGFTEFNVLEECRGYTGTQGPLIEYRVTNGGNDSFHGTGWRDSTWNQQSAQAIAKIGAGALVYNAPWDGTLFSGIGTSTSFFDTVDTTKPIRVHGTIRIENNNVTRCLHNGVSANSPAMHAGDVTTLGSGIVFNRVDEEAWIQTYRSDNKADGTTRRNRKPGGTEWTLDGTTAKDTINFDVECAFIHVHIQGPNYSYEHLLFGGGAFGSPGGYVITISDLKQFNAAALGPATFSFNNATNRLTINKGAAWPAGFVAQINRMDIRGRDSR